jgi:hypothetical protein
MCGVIGDSRRSRMREAFVGHFGVGRLGCGQILGALQGVEHLHAADATVLNWNLAKS